MRTIPISALFLVLQTVFALNGIGQELKSGASKGGTAEPSQFEPLERVQDALSTTRASREGSSAFALINYSPIDLLIPSKIGLTAGWVQDADRTWELEYLRGTLSVPFLIDELGSFKDERISVIRRSYFGNNSFNISYGLTYSRFALTLGNDILGRLPTGVPGAINMLSTDALGFNFAVGNRWIFDHGITFGVDWFSWAQPLIVTHEDNQILNYVNNANDRENVDTALKLMKYFPRFAFFKLQLGMSF